MLPLNSLSIETHTLVDFDGPVLCERLFYGEIELSNAIHLVDWNSDPVFPSVSAGCLDPECCGMGLARVARSETQLLWMKPYQTEETWLDELVHPSRLIINNLLIEKSAWDEVQWSHEYLPEFFNFPQITNHDLYHLWRQELPDFVVPNEYETWARHLEQNCIASHPLDLDAAIAEFELVLQTPETPIEVLSGSFHRVDVTEETFQHFYFDGEGTPEFAAYSVEPPRRLLIDDDYIFS